MFQSLREDQEYLYTLELERRRQWERERDLAWEEVARRKALAAVGTVKQSTDTCSCGARLEYREGLLRPRHVGPNGQSVACKKTARSA